MSSLVSSSLSLHILSNCFGKENYDLNGSIMKFWKKRLLPAFSEVTRESEIDHKLRHTQSLKSTHFRLLLVT